MIEKHFSGASLRISSGSTQNLSRSYTVRIFMRDHPCYVLHPVFVDDFLSCSFSREACKLTKQENLLIFVVLRQF